MVVGESRVYFLQGCGFGEVIYVLVDGFIFMYISKVLSRFYRFIKNIRERMKFGGNSSDEEGGDLFDQNIYV